MRTIKMGTSAIAVAALSIGLIAPSASASEVEEASSNVVPVETVVEVEHLDATTADQLADVSEEDVEELPEEIADAEIAPALVYAARHCLMGIGLNSTQITRMAEFGSTTDILQAFGFAAVRCVMGR